MNVVKKLLGSRKFVVMLLGMLGAVCARLGLPEEAASEMATLIVVCACAFCGSQGMADFAKEREAVKAEAKEDD